jgi:hypothetical protein
MDTVLTFCKHKSSIYFSEVRIPSFGDGKIFKQGFGVFWLAVRLQVSQEFLFSSLPHFFILIFYWFRE